MAGFVAAGMLSPLSIQQAQAACSGPFLGTYFCQDNNSAVTNNNADRAVIATGDLYDFGDALDINTNNGDVGIVVGAGIDVLSVFADGIDVVSNNGAIGLLLGGDIYADDNGVRIETNLGDVGGIVADTSEIETDDGDGIQITTNGGSVDYWVAGDIDAGEDGIDIQTGRGGDVELTVTSDSTIRADDNGIEIDTVRGDIDLTFNGNIFAGENGIDLFSEEGDVDFEMGVGGDIYAWGDGVRIETEEGDVFAAVEGDITAGEDGVQIDTDEGDVDGYVAETSDIVAGENGLQFRTNSGNVDYTVAGDIFAFENGIDIETTTNGFSGGDVELTVTSDSTIRAFDNGIDIDTNRGDVELFFNGDIFAGDNGIGINTDEGNVFAAVGPRGDINADDDGLKIETEEGDVVALIAGDIDAGEDGVQIDTDEGDIDGYIAETSDIVAGENGVQIETDSGDVDFTVAGDIFAFENGIDIETNTNGFLGGDVELTVTSDSSIFAFDNGIEIDTNRGDVDLFFNGDIFAFDNGIDIETDEGDVFALVGPRGDVNAFDDGLKIETEEGDVLAVIAGDINAGEDGVQIDTDEGDARGYITETSRIVAGENGVQIETDSGDVDFTVAGDIFAGENGIDIETNTNNWWGGDVELTVTSDSSIFAFDNGIDIDTNRGDVDLLFNGDIFAGDNGIDIETDEGDVFALIGPRGDINAFDDGLKIETEEGDVLAVIAGDINAGEDGVQIDTEEGDARGYITETSRIVAGENGVQIETESGDVDFTVAGDIFAGENGIDIETNTNNWWGGDVELRVTSESTIFALDNGIDIDTNRGDVEVGIAGDIFAFDHGVNIETDEGDVDFYLARQGDIFAAEDGIRVDSEEGDVNLYIAGDIRAGESAINVNDGDDVRVIIGSTASLVGEGGWNTAVVELDADDSIELYNFGDIRSSGWNLDDQSDDLAIDVSGGVGSFIVNAGTITGRFDGSSDDDVFVNLSGETWNFTGISDFGGYNDDDLLVNYAGGPFDGVIRNAFDWNERETAQYLSLETFYNSGEITLEDQEFGETFYRDRAFVEGNFIGDYGLISLDADLEVQDSDRFIIEGDVSGTTFVAINDLGDQNNIVFNAYGIPVIEIDGDIEEGTNFELVGGPRDYGLFSYDLHYTEDMEGRFYGNGPGQNALALSGLEGYQSIDRMWVLATTLDAEAYQLPVLAYGAANLWHASSGVWSDRTTDLRSVFRTGAGGGGADLVVDPAVPAAPASPSVAPGIWGRVFGGTLERDFDNDDGFGNTIEDSFRQNYYGFVGGIDFAREAGPNSAWLFGVLGAYTGSDVDFDQAGGNADYQQGSIGGYITYLNGGFFADALVKADFGKLDYSGGGDSDSSDYTSVGVVLDTGYRFNYANGWFIEPKATLAYVNTDFDNLDLLGTGVDFEDGDSLRGRLGGRVGATIDKGGNLFTPYVEASVWNEFDGDFGVGLSGVDGLPDVSYDIGGTYGEVAGGADFVKVGSGWSAFAKGAVQFGEDSLVGVSGNLGLRKNW
jgi:hypothetical protein